MTRESIDTADVRRIVAESARPEARGRQGELHLGEVDGRRIFVKAAAGNVLSAGIRRWMLRREYDVYRRLEGARGIPRCFGFYDGRYLVLEAIEGQTLRHAAVGDHEGFYRQLLEVIESMHAREVSHGDLMRKDNIIVDRQESPVLVDFGVATVYRRGLHPVNHLAFRFFRQLDLNAWLKHKYRHQWNRMAPEDARRYRPLLLDDLARGIKRTWKALRGRSNRPLH